MVKQSEDCYGQLQGSDLSTQTNKGPRRRLEPHTNFLPENPKNPLKPCFDHNSIHHSSASNAVEIIINSILSWLFFIERKFHSVSSTKLSSFQWQSFVEEFIATSWFSMSGLSFFTPTNSWQSIVSFYAHLIFCPVKFCTILAKLSKIYKFLIWPTPIT